MTLESRKVAGDYLDADGHRTNGALSFTFTDGINEYNAMFFVKDLKTLRALEHGKVYDTCTLWDPLATAMLDVPVKKMRFIIEMF